MDVKLIVPMFSEFQATRRSQLWAVQEAMLLRKSSLLSTLSKSYATKAVREVARVAGRFNERLVLSLASCPTCILMDDELNILPTSSHVARIAPLPLADDGTPAVPTASASSAAELKELVASLADTQVQVVALWAPWLQLGRRCAFKGDQPASAAAISCVNSREHRPHVSMACSLQGLCACSLVWCTPYNTLDQPEKPHLFSARILYNPS